LIYNDKEVVSTTSKKIYTRAVNSLVVKVLSHFVAEGE